MAMQQFHTSVWQVLLYFLIHYSHWPYIYYVQGDKKRILEKQINLVKAQENWKEALRYQEKLTQLANPKNDKVWVDKGNF
jgi:hypothetical protein